MTSDAPTIPSTAALRDVHAVCCAHCGDSVPKGLIDGASQLHFCCSGCRIVYEVIHQCGLDRYYTLISTSESSTRRAEISDRHFGEMDDPTFHRLYVKSLAAGVAQVELFLPAAHCAACVWLVERLPRVCPGVIEAHLDLRRALVRITWQTQHVALSQIARFLASLGYPPTPARQASMREARRLEDRRQIIRLGVAGACAGNVMLLALAMYAGMFDAIDAAHLHLFRWASMAISVVSLAWPGNVFFRGAWNALRTRSLHLDLPIAVGLGAGGIWGVISTIAGTGEIYFDSLSVLVFALLLGRHAQWRQQRWSADSLELLFSLTPTTARVVNSERTGEVSELPIEAVETGMLVEVHAGDSVPVDGVIVQGTSSMDQSLLTGESQPVQVREGMGVAAGAVNLSSTLRIRVEATGENTRVGRLMHMVEQATQRKAPIVRAADRIAGWFVAIMLALAALTAGIWLIIDASRAIDNAVALLIVTCPCALGLATPLAVTVAIGRAARRKMLIKGGDVIERLAKPGVMLLDKTGTITQGRLSLVQWYGDDSLKPVVAAIERHSTHPIASALTRDLSSSQSTAHVSEVLQTTGAGMTACWNGHAVVVGSPAFVIGNSVDSAQSLKGVDLAISQRGYTPLLIAVDGTVMAAAALGDAIRDDARASIERLQSAGWQVRMLSGDHPDVVKRVGQHVGIHPDACRGGASPEDKLDVVRDASLGSRTVVMVGDGVNDAAALAAASVGIAVHGGAEASLAAADVYLNTPGLSPIVALTLASRRTMRIIRRNFALSLFYNIFAALLAVTGVINPLIAAVLMPLSSLTVVLSSYQSRTFESEKR